MSSLSAAPTELTDLNDAALNEQRAAFVAVLAENEGIIGHEWNIRTTEIACYAAFMGDGGDECDAETRRELCVAMETGAYDLRRKHDETQLAAMLLSGTTPPRYFAAVDLRSVTERATSCKSITWEEPNPIIVGSEDHIFAILSALSRLGGNLGFFPKGSVSTLQINMTSENDTILFTFTGDTNPAYFTDPDAWFTINPKRGSESIGLFVARELARINGGKIWVEAADKTHFDFRLRLPLVQSREINTPDE